MTGRGARRAAHVLAALAAAAAALSAGAARAQDPPHVISPLRIESDHQGVNLLTGRTPLDMPVLSVPGAPNLRFDRIQNVAPYVSGRVQNQGFEPGYDRRSYSVHTGTGSSDSLQCIDFDCTSVSGTGSIFIANSRIYRQSGSGAVWHFDLKHVHTTGLNQALLYYASSVSYPNGETISYSYQTATLNGDPFPGRLFYRPVTVASNLGYFIAITYQGSDFNGDPGAWGSPQMATLYASAAPTTPLGRLTYSGSTITDLGGRVYGCTGCNNGLGAEIEVAAGTLQLPGEASPAAQIAAHPSAQVVGSVTRDGVQWTYSYENLRSAATNFGYVYDRLTVTGPNGFHNVYQTFGSPYGNAIMRITDSLGRATNYGYDEYARPTQIVSPEGNQVDVGYDQYGNLFWRRMRAKPGSGLADITETANFPTDTCFNAGTPILCYRPTWSRDGLGRQTDYAYNSLGQLTEQTDPADAGGVRRRTSISYQTGLSRRSAVRICADTGASCGTNAPIQTEYDYWGSTFLPSAERRIDAATGTTLTTAYSYDAAGRLLSTDGPLPGSEDATYNRYDLYGRKTWEIGGNRGDGLRIATRYTYRDSDDKPVSSETGTLTAADGTDLAVFRRTDIAYDSRRNPVRGALSAGGTTYTVTDRSFDDRGQVECVAARMNMAAFGSLPASACTAGTPGSQGPDRITRTLYDAAGQRLQLREGMGTTDEGTEATWDYNLNGQITAVIDGNGNRAELRYDGHGRQDRWTFPSATRAASFNDATPATALATAGSVNSADYEQYGYDAAGNRTSLRKRDGSTLSYSYDNLNRMTVKTVPERTTGPQPLTPAQTRDVHYSYDLRNLQLSARFDSQSGEGITNVYDGFGRLISSSTNMGGTTRTLSYQYDAAGGRMRITHPDGPWFGILRDGLDRPYWLYSDPAAGVYYSSYRPDGLPAGQSRGNGASTWTSRDAVQRFNGLGHYYGGGTPADVLWLYQHNPAGQIASVNRDNEAYAWTGHYAVNRNYTTNGLNQYTAAGGATFGYDLNGNLTSDGIRTYLYDIENRMVGGNGATLSYDPLGRLYQVNASGGGVTRFLYDGDALVAEYNGAGEMTRRYVHWDGADVPIMAYTNATLASPTYLHADHQGSIVALSDAPGAPVTINRYDEYGIPAATNTGRFQYTGQAWLAELGMYYYKARFYSPTLGRFMQTDPIGYEGGVNLYAYVDDDPVNATDPEGTYKCNGSEKDCETIAGYASQVGQAAARAGRQTGSRIPSQYASALNVLARTLGRPGEENGVTITSASLGEGVLGATGRGPGGTVEIELDLPNIQRSRGSTGAGTLAHETTHGVQQRARGLARTLSDVYHRELVANYMESLTNQMLGQSTSVWGPDMSRTERQQRVRQSAFQSCDFARRSFPSQYRGQQCGP